MKKSPYLLLCIPFCQVAVESTCNQRRLGRDCADMQAGLNLRWLHTSYYRFCRVLAQIRVCWVYTLEPPWSGNSNEYTYCFSDKKILLLKISLKIVFLSYRKNFLGTQKTTYKLKYTMVNQPSLYESLKFYCLFVCQAYYSHTELHHLGRHTLWPVLYRTREYYHDVLTSCSTASVGCSSKNMWVRLFWQCSTVLSTSLGISFFPRRFILNETILFWLTMYYPKPFVLSVCVFLYPPYKSGRVLWFHVG